jgi:phytoene dehydrogenase-like protein
MNSTKPIVIIGAGISGLAAARLLKAAGKSILILEKEDRIGGRVKTDSHDGFLFDHGFQVLLTAYPELKTHLDIKRLDLNPFVPGAVLFNEGEIMRFVDPLRRKSALFQTLFSSAGTLKDKWKIFQLSLALKNQSLEEIFSKEELSTMEYLKQIGFSDQIINHFLQPFLSGIFLEPHLNTSSRMFEFIFKMFSEGDTAIPSKGMIAIPQQLAESLHPGDIQNLTKVIAIEGRTVHTEKGAKIEAEHIVVASPFQKFYNSPQEESENPSTTTLYFAAERSPLKEGILALNFNGRQLTNHIAVLSDVASSYAPEGKSLISVSLVGQHTFIKESLLVNSVLEELHTTFPKAHQWKHLKTYHVSKALPSQISVTDSPDPKRMFPSEHITFCGDELMNGSLNAALKSGRLAAERLLRG